MSWVDVESKAIETALPPSCKLPEGYTEGSPVPAPSVRIARMIGAYVYMYFCDRCGGWLHGMFRMNYLETHEGARVRTRRQAVCRRCQGVLAEWKGNG